MAHKPLPKSSMGPTMAESPRQAKPPARAPGAAAANGKTADGPGRAPDRKAAGAGEEWKEREGWLRNAVRQAPSWLVSTVLHMIILLVLALLTLPEGIADDLRQLIVAPGEEEEFDDLEELEDEPLENIDVNVDVTAIESDLPTGSRRPSCGTVGSFSVTS